MNLLATDHRASILAGGTKGWDRTMDADPPAPPESASSIVWQQHRTHVALRRFFGDTAAAAGAPVAPMAAPIAPAFQAGVGAKKREGC